jgi:hypothetical protein
MLGGEGGLERTASAHGARETFIRVSHFSAPQFCDWLHNPS